MVHIRKLEIRGFKSLGNRPLTLEFDKSLVIITGPNGGGKSNIIDAIIFCLGQNNPKILRVNRLVSLIYDGGSQGQKPLNTRVTVTLDNLSKGIPIDSETVTVTRELKIDGESTYYLNGKRVPKNTVSDILSLSLISPDGFNIVPQGMVTKISEFSPDEKRELIGEITGVAQFDHKKAEALSMLKEADTRLQVALARMSEINKRVDSLEGERNDQLRLKRLEDEIRWLRAALASRNLIDIRRKLKEQEQLIENTNVGLKNLQNRLGEQDTKLSSVEHERGTFISTVIDGAGSRIIEIQSSLANTKHENEILSHDMTRAEEVVNNIEGSLPNLKQTQEKLHIEISGVEDNVSKLSIRISELEKTKVETEKELSLIISQKAKATENLSNANNAVENLHRNVERLDQNLKTVIGKIDNLKERQRLSLERLKNIQDKSRSFLETLNRLESHLEELNRLKSMEEASLVKVDESVEDLSSRMMLLEEEIAKAVSILNKAGTAVLKYETQRSVAEQLVADEIGLAKLDELGRDGALEGFVGRLDRLIAFNPQYEQAVLAAGNRWIKAIIVEDLKAMLKIIELAKRLKTGRFTIIPSSEVADSTKVTPPHGEGIIGSLAELITVERGREGLVNFVFGDAVLVRSARIAYEISLRGFKAVTLVGDIFEPKSTVFETGYLARIDILAGMIRDETSILPVKDALRSLRGIISKRKADIRQLDKQVKRFGSERAHRTLIMERLTTEMDNVSKFAAKYRRLKSNIEKKDKELSKLPERLQRQIDGLTAAYSSIKSRIELCKKKIEEANTQIISDEIRTLDEKKALCLDHIEKVSSDIREIMTQLARDQSNLEHNLRPSLHSVVEQIQQFENELNEKKHSIEEGKLRQLQLVQQIQSLKAEEENLLDSYKKSRPLLESYDGRLKNLRQEESKLRREVTNLEKELLDANRSRERLVELEQRHLNELALFGYSAPIEYFDESEILLQYLNLEYDALRNKVNLLAEAQYKEVYVGYKNLSLRRNQLEAERNTIVNFIESVDREKKQVFIKTFERIDKELRQVFSRLTGGSAWLEIEKPDDIFASGIFLMTQFPGKIPRESNSVSGGEKTISAISFLLAIQSVYPSPFYLFDEIDAHLDAVNSERLIDLLKERVSSSQIIMVSLKDSAVSTASIVYGLYMKNGFTQAIKYKPKLQVAVEHV